MARHRRRFRVLPNEETLPKGASPTKVTQWVSEIRALPLGGGAPRTVVGNLDHAGPLVGAGPGKLLVVAGSGDARSVRLIDTTTDACGCWVPPPRTNRSEIASDGATAHWVSGTTIYSAPLAGGDAAVYFSNTVVPLQAAAPPPPQTWNNAPAVLRDRSVCALPEADRTVTVEVDYTDRGAAA